MSLVEIGRFGRTVLVTLNDPKRRNVLSGALCVELSSAIAAANADAEVNALVITGAAPAFCAGADLADLRAAAAGQVSAVHAVYQSFIDVANSALPTIAAVNGAAVGAGLNLALACDVRLASPQASFDTRFLQIGLHPGGGHSWLLQRAIGWAEAARLLLFARTLLGDEALRTGLVQQLHAEPDLLDAAVDLARQTDGVPRDLLLRTKATMRHAATSAHADAVVHETEQQFWSLGQPAFTALVDKLQRSMAKR